MYKNVAFVDVGFDEIVEGIEERGDILIFPIEEGVYYVEDARAVADMVHVLGRGDHCIAGGVPVVMFLEERESVSRADCTSPMKMRWEERGWVKTGSEG